MVQRRRTRVVAVLAAVSLVMAACGGSTSEDDEPVASGEGQDGELLVVATTSILGDVVGELVDEDGTVEVLMGPGVDPHAFQPSAEQARLVREADLVVANGLQLEESLLDTLEAAQEEDANVIRVAEDLDPIAYDGGEGHEDEGDHDDEGSEHDHDDEAGEGDHDDEGEHDHDHGAFDPHVWMDPVRMAAGVELIATELADVDTTLDDGEWVERGDRYVQVLTDLDGEIDQMLIDLPPDRRKLVTNHDAFSYFADRYDLDVVGTVIPGSSTQADPSAADFAELAEVIIEEDVPAIFTETTSSDRQASALAEEVGRDVAIVQLYSGALGDEGSGVETYVDLLRHDAEAIASALG